MSTQSEIFFFISSIGFITLWVLAVIFLIYLIRAMHTFSRILKQIENGIDEIGDSTKDLLLDMRESPIFRFIFGKKRKSRKE